MPRSQSWLDLGIVISDTTGHNPGLSSRSLGLVHTINLLGRADLERVAHRLGTGKSPGSGCAPDLRNLESWPMRSALTHLPQEKLTGLPHEGKNARVGASTRYRRGQGLWGAKELGAWRTRSRRSSSHGIAGSGSKNAATMLPMPMPARDNSSLPPAPNGLPWKRWAASRACVFLAFVLGGERDIGEFGVGLATAILLDALILRTVLVPAAMQLFGTANWWIPGWLDRALPHLSLEVPKQPHLHGAGEALHRPVHP